MTAARSPSSCLFAATASLVAALMGSADAQAGGTWGDNPEVVITPGPLCNGGTWGDNPEVVIGIAPGIGVSLEEGGDPISAVATDCLSNGAITKLQILFGSALVITGVYEGVPLTMELDADPTVVAVATPFIPGQNTLYILDLDPETDAGVADALASGQSFIEYTADWQMEATVLRWNNPGTTFISNALATYY
jgi:hypothetical protein